MSSYPAGATARDRFVLDRRPPRARHDPWRAQGWLVEDERAADGTVARVATVFLTGRECPWRCVMCDLWQYTTESDTPRGAIPAQIAAARRALESSSQPVTGMKLYNAGSFFDPRAVPDADYDEIAAAPHAPHPRHRRIASLADRRPDQPVPHRPRVQSQA